MRNFYATINLMATTFNEESQQKKLDELRRQEEEDLAQLLGERYSIPYLNLTAQHINTDALKIVTEQEAREAGVAAFDIVGRKLKLLLTSPSDKRVMQILDELKTNGYDVATFIGSRHSAERAWERYREIEQSIATRAGLIDVSQEALEEFRSKIKTVAQLQAVLDEAAAQSHGTSLVFEAMLAGAVSADASDIHLEPQEGLVNLRYRLDGVLQAVGTLDKTVYKLLLSRIKLVSGMKLNVKAAAQDGRFTIRSTEADIEIRSSILPGPYGESVVMRLLNPKTISVELEQLGMPENLLEVIRREIKKPNGMILTTGPTGSGKTTTLYAFIKKVNEPGIKIITIEDPIEYHLKGITQTQVEDEKGYTFLEGLRSSLRQDPDIIMVGEIRDSETAKIAINASLTGHLVFSTLHTNNAAGTIPRLIDLGVNPKVISSALTVSMAQRLVRKLCQVCRREDKPNQHEEGTIKRVVEQIKKKRPQEAAALQVTKIWRAVGCADCHNTGYRGRTGVFEAILTDEAIEAIVTSNPSEREIKKAALPQGILDMEENGIMKVLQGVTSFEELLRVVEIVNL